MNAVKVNFSNITGLIRPLHGVNNCTRKALWEDLTDDFKALKLPIVRLHDTGGEYGGSHYVDVPNIFPDFDADVDDPESYDFTLTDIYLKYLVESGCEVMYRLGVTIEHAPKKYHIFPPKDPKKWAEICEHIVRHYNEGWADGYRFGIKYWEIWNEPDGTDPYIETYGQPMWTGTPEQYYELYSITANHLKKHHPDIRVGGYSSCMIRGSFTNGRWTVGVTGFHEGFFDYITAEETRAPLDFFTWHTYLGHDDIPRINEDAKYARELLDRYGFTETENFNTEWNHYLSEDKLYRMELMKNEMGASHIAATMCEMQRAGLVDKAMFYAAGNNSGYNALYTSPGRRTTKSYHTFRLFGEVYEMKNECSVECSDKSLYTVAAANKGEGVLMLVNPHSESRALAIELSGLGVSEAQISVIDAERDGEALPIPVEALSSIVLSPYSVTLIRVR